MGPNTLKRWRNRLPHWEIENGIYFITVRCTGSLPQEIRQKIKELQISLETIEPRDAEFIQLQRQIFLTSEKYLDGVEDLLLSKSLHALRPWQIRSRDLNPDGI